MLKTACRLLQPPPTGWLPLLGWEAWRKKKKKDLRKCFSKTCSAEETSLAESHGLLGRASAYFRMKSLELDSQNASASCYMSLKVMSNPADPTSIDSGVSRLMLGHWFVVYLGNSEARMIVDRTQGMIPKDH